MRHPPRRGSPLVKYQEDYIEEETYACPSLSTNTEQDKRASHETKHTHLARIRNLALPPPPQQTRQATYHMPPNWQLRYEDFKRGWVYTGTQPASTNGAWSHEATGAWFLNIDGNCYPWRQELDPMTGCSFLWLQAGATVTPHPPFFWIHNQA